LYTLERDRTDLHTRDRTEYVLSLWYSLTLTKLYIACIYRQKNLHKARDTLCAYIYRQRDLYIAICIYIESIQKRPRYSHTCMPVYTDKETYIFICVLFYMAMYRSLCLYIQVYPLCLYIQTKKPIYSHIKQDTYKYIGLFVCIYRHIRMAISRSLLYTLYIYTYGYI